ncbi:hypothetical protein J1N35_038333 [Gossypium stocksii]|uniref:Uncharacterized protein n=1 Tax=Gossypium stocksii TaxID=47602 RepID=A0A9D3UNM1_9ROSI|nr:hypothetical protein J1N35_038333 [Gossypium stocksii]
MEVASLPRTSLCDTVKREVQWKLRPTFAPRSRRDEVPLIVVFQNLYQLKAYNRECVVGLFYFTPREDVKIIVSNWCSNLRLSRWQITAVGMPPNQREMIIPD